MKFLKIRKLKSTRLFWGLILLIGFTFSNCSKDELEINQENLMGVWVSTNSLDTLEFVDTDSFYKNHDHFDYSLSNDSIEIRYNGVLYVLAHPSNHKYTLTDNTLTIDFTNTFCYGFASTIETFEKQ